MRKLFSLLAIALLTSASVYAQAVAGDPLLKGQADVANAEIAAGANIASSKLATDVLVETDVGDGLEVVTNTIHTKSDETGFLEDLGAGDLTCGAATAGRLAVNDADALQYCDGAATPVRRVAAFGADNGDALTGDTATAFFAAGQIEAARGGTGIDTSGSTGVTRVAAGTWSADAGISHLASSTSADLRGVLSDETGGAGVAVFNINPTLTDVTVDDVLFFTETAGDATCAAGDYWIKGNSTSTTLRGCENGSLFTLSAGGTNPLSIASPEALTIATGAVTLTGAANTLTYHSIDTEAAAASDDLTTINCTAGSQHVIFAAADARTVVVKASSLFAISDFSMDNTADRLELHCHAANVTKELSRANNGA